MLLTLTSRWLMVHYNVSLWCLDPEGCWQWETNAFRLGVFWGTAPLPERFQVPRLNSVLTGAKEGSCFFCSESWENSDLDWYLFIFGNFWCHSKLGGGLKHFLFSPLFGEDFQFDEHIFQMGWFNHQPENVCTFFFGPAASNFFTCRFLVDESWGLIGD